MTRRNSVARVSSFVNLRELRIESLEDRRLLALVPELVADINLEMDSLNPEVRFLTNVNGTLFFAAADAVSGRELWKSDGTEAGTERVKDIWPGTDGSSPYSLTNFNGELFFTVGSDGVSSGGLWKSDGTESGTVRVTEIPAGIGSLTNVNGTLFFAARGLGGEELWKSDGTEAGTVRVKDIRAGSNGSFPSSLTNVNGTLFFRATDGVSGRELWKSDGTEAGTVQVKDIRTGNGHSAPEGLTNIGGTLFFRATDGVSGTELWKSDGTEAGTVRVKDIRAGSESSYPGGFTNFNGTVFFVADDGVSGPELWKSDGTEAGTVRVKDIRTGSDNSIYGGLANVSGTLFFTADDGVSGTELWRSDGTEAGTMRVKDIWAGPRYCLEYTSYESCAGFGGYSSPSSLNNVEGTLFFTADDGVSGRELWRSDGTEAGTVRVKDIWAGPRYCFEYEFDESCGRFGGQSSPFYLTDINGTLFFVADDGVRGQELWKSNGTEAGTVLVKDIRGGSVSSDLRYRTNINGTLLFTADDGVRGQELWKSDGTVAGTVPVKDIYAGTGGSFPSSLTNVNDTLFFVAGAGFGGNELWKSDGTEAGTVGVKDIRAGSESSFASGLTNVNGTLFLTAYNDIGGRELWKSDGTGLGTVQVKDISVGSGGSDPNFLTNVNGMLFFTAFDGVSGRELWKSDGTEAGTVRVKDIWAGSGHSYPRSLTNVNGTLFFAADDGVGGQELWKSDGTEAGTVRVKDVLAGSVGSDPHNLTDINGTLFFAATGVGGVELWKSDGTEVGTVRVKDVLAGSAGSDPHYLTGINGTLFFAAAGVGGVELWKSDGTEAGTVRVKDIFAGSGGSDPRQLTNVNGSLFFTAYDGVSGFELWRSDGTEAGTVRIDDIVPGGASSNPGLLTAVGNTLYFTADDGIHGRELWKVVVEDEEPVPPPAGPEFRVNTFTAGDQRGFPTSPGQIAMAADGSVVVTWTSVGQEGTGDEIYFQRYNARGTPVGGEVRANAMAAGNQRNSTIAAAADGSFVIAWNDDHVAANNFDIYARRFDAQGVPLGEEFLVNALSVAGAQRSPVVAASPDGRFAVVWHGPDASSNGIFARLYASDGTPLSDEFPVNTHTTGQQQIKSAAMSANGALIVVWQSDGQDGDAGGIYARIFEDDGTPRTSEFLAPQTLAGSQQNPSVAVDQAGNFLVTWTSDGQDDDAGGIYARRFNPAGEPQGDEVRVNETTASAQRYSTVAMDAEGDALITWSSLVQDGEGYGIYARRYNSVGQPEGHEFRVNTYTAGNQIYSSLALDVDGDFVVVWSSQGQDGDGYGVYGQRYAVPRPAQPGDTDADGDVDLEDLNAVRNHFGEIGDGAPGDTFPFDGDVDLDDLNVVRNNFGATSSLLSELLAKRNAPTRALMSDDSALASLAGATRPAETLRSDHVQAAFDQVHAYAAGVWQRCNEALADLEVEAPWQLAITPQGRRIVKR